MRVHVVSDVHGRSDALAAAGGADALICLGDLLLFIDYADHGQGIFADLFGARQAQDFVALRTAKWNSTFCISADDDVALILPPRCQGWLTRARPSRSRPAVAGSTFRRSWAHRC